MLYPPGKTQFDDERCLFGSFGDSGSNS